MKKPYAITLDVGTSLVNHTGTWRTNRPTYVHKLPPCNNQCPAGENIQGWLFQAEGGNYEEAWKLLTLRNPLPACMGRVCYHTCEGACNRGKLDECVGINSVERFLGDYALENGYSFPKPAKKTGKKVLVVGSGPASLSAAYQLALKGHEVTIKESSEQPGGMMRYGIPKYRLPRGILDAEIKRILNLGVKLELNVNVTDVEKEMKNGFDAVFLGVGAHHAKRAYIPGGDAKHMLDAVAVLRSMESGGEVLLGRKVAVYGGGNTAIDVARSAKRLGAEPLIIYRRTREKMPAHEFELEDALQEGVSVKWLTTITEVESNKELKVEKMILNKEGRAEPTGEFETVKADTVVLALGQDVDLGLLEKLKGLKIEDGVVQVDANQFTGVKGVYAGGDMVPGDRNVTVAIGHGYKAARAIDAYLSGKKLKIEPKHEVVTFDQLNTWYYSDAPKTVRPVLDIVRRQSTFDEVQQGLTEENALFEARRCMSCGNCLQCDNCYGVCPDNAVIKTGKADVPYKFNYDYCKGCGVCATECPCGAIKMEKESI